MTNEELFSPFQGFNPGFSKKGGGWKIPMIPEF